MAVEFSGYNRLDYINICICAKRNLKPYQGHELLPENGVHDVIRLALDERIKARLGRPHKTTRPVISTLSITNVRGVLGVWGRSSPKHLYT